MPDSAGPSASTSDPQNISTVSSGGAAGAVSGGPGAASAAAPSVESGVAGAAPAAPPTEAEQDVGLLDYAKTMYGVDLSSLGDDQKAVQYLLGLHQQYQQHYPQLQRLAQYGQEYLQHQGPFQEWLKTRQQPQPAAPTVVPPAQPGWWNPPAQRAEVESLVAKWAVRDPQTGKVSWDPTTPPSIIQKVADYQQYIADWRQKIEHNPQEAFSKLIQEQAQKVIQEQFQQQNVRKASEDVINRHAPWLFHRDPTTGIPIYGQYTPQGVAFWNYILQAERMGVSDIHNQEHYALSMIQRDMYSQQQYAPAQAALPAVAPTSPAQPPPAARQASYAQPNPQSPARGGAINLAQLIRQDLAANGIHRFNLPDSA